MNTLEIFNPFQVGEAILDNSLKAMTAVSAAQEQGDKFFRQMLDQNRVVREQGMKMAQNWSEQARESQKQFANLVTGSFRAGLDAVKIVSQHSATEVAKQVDHVSKTVEAASKKR